MCGFVGFSSVKEDLSKNINIIKDMSLKLKKIETEEEEYFINKNINLGSRSLKVLDSENKKQQLSIKYNDNIYTGICNGEIYNKEEIIKELKSLEYEFMRKFKHRSFTKSFYSLWNKCIK